MDTQITIADVAKSAGVSTATAGRVVGGYGNVSEKSREKVLRAVRELNYRPNMMAQSLRRNTTNTIAVILGSIKNNYCNRLIYAIEKEAQKYGCNVIICNTHEDPQQEYRHLQEMYSRHVDGVILMSSVKDFSLVEESYRDLYIGDMPIVFVDRTIRGLNSYVVQCNNKEVSYEAVDYLIGLGHKKIGVLATDDYSTVKERIEGYYKALEDHGLPCSSELILYSDQNYKQSLEYFREKKITAMYVLNNNLCIDVLNMVKRRNLCIPKDLSLVVWDDEEINDYLDITTIAQPVEQIGKIAVKNLLKKKEMEKNTENHEILKAEILFRKSCDIVS